MSERAIAEKITVVDELKDKISRARVMVISDYLKFTVKEITGLRKKLRAENSELRIIKNTLIERAFSETGFEQLSDHLKGPTALLLGYKDAVSPLKVLVKFLKDAEKGAIRAGMVLNSVFSEKDLNAMARLPSREVLLSKMIGGMQAPLYGLANVLQGPIRKLVYALEAIRGKKGGE